MKEIKGCCNESCEAHKNRIIYMGEESFCTQCGSMLFYVCKDCYTQLPDDVKKYCERCLAKHKDRRDTAKKVAGIAVSAVGVIAIGGKRTLDFIKSIKG